MYRLLVSRISSCSKQFITKDCDYNLERSERMQLRVCMFNVEANEPSLENRRIKLGMKYATKSKVYPQGLVTIHVNILSMHKHIHALIVYLRG